MAWGDDEAMVVAQPREDGPAVCTLGRAFAAPARRRAALLDASVRWRPRSVPAPSATGSRSHGSR